MQADVNEGDYEQGTPEDDVGQSYDDEHLDVLDTLLLELYHAALYLIQLCRGYDDKLLEL